MKNVDLRKLMGILLLFGLLMNPFGKLLAQTYCSSGATNTADSRIDYVGLAGNSTTISNTSTSGCAVYTNYTSLAPADLSPGGSYTITVTAGTCNGNYDKGAIVFIDWNHDYDFTDAGETIGYTTVTNPTATFTIPMVVPAYALMGNTRMRVIVVETTSPSTIAPCGTFSYGETEDYSVFITAASDNDMGVVGVTPANICTGVSDFYAIVANYGGLTAANYKVDWSFGGVAQPQISVSNSILSGQTDTVFLGTLNFVNSMYDIIIYTSMPNGVADTINYNDTLSLLPFFLSLNGTYTVGATGDFLNFNEAVGALSVYGICGPVVFEVEAGTYNEQISIGQVSGVNATNTVTFKSASGVNSDVVLQYNATGTANNWVVNLDGGDYYSFEDMTIKSQNGTYGRVVRLVNGAHHNSFSGNILQAPQAASTSNYMAVVVNESGLGDTANVFHNNDVLNGSYGFYMYGGSSTSPELNNEITHNNILNFYYYGLYLYYQGRIKVEYNTIESGLYSTHYGIYTYYMKDNFRIVGNQLHLKATSTNYCMYIYYADGGPSRGLVANNFVSQSVGTSTAYGMYVYYSSNVNIYNNSINITAGSTTSTAIYVSQAAAGGYGNIEIVNNSLVNTGGGYAINILDAAMTAGMVSYQDYNNYHSTNASPILFGVWTVNNLTDLNLIEPHSIMVNPAYSSVSDLHSYSPFLVDAGKPLSSVPFDVDMEPRDPLTPNIGADEYTLYTNDAGMSAFVGIDAICPGLIPVSANINNYGLVELTEVNVSWSVNGVTQTSVMVYDTIPVGGFTTVFLGNYTFLSGVIYDVIGWASMPNGVVDPSNTNDTTSLVGLQTAAAGTFTIGAAGDFATLTDAQTFIENYGVCGPVIFNILPGIYDEQLTLNEVSGVDAVNTVTWQSSTGNKADVTVQYAATGTGDNWVWRFYGADYNTVQNITMKSTTASTYGRVLLFHNSSNYNQVLNNDILSIITTSSNSATVYSYSDSKDEYNIISGNIISGAYYGIYWYGSSANLENGNQFIDNEIVDFYYYGVYNYYQFANTLVGNYVAQNPAGSTTCYPMYVYYCDGPIVVTNNKLFDDAGATYYGLRIYYCDATAAAPGLIANNMVSCIGNTGTQYGLYIGYSIYQKIYHNSVYLANGSTNYGAYLYITSTAYGPFDFKNNSIVNMGSGGYCLYGTSAGMSMLTSDHNNLYSNSATLCSFSTAYPTLSAWQALYPGDVVSTDGGYLAPDNLHSNSLLLDGAALAVPEVTTDFDGDSRSITTPDIGADEYVLANDDAGISGMPGINALCPGLSDITVTLNNYGLVALSSVTINWEVNGVTQTPFSFTGNILPGNSQDVLIGSYNLLSTGNYSFTVWTTLPNGNNDPNSSNDSYSITGVTTAVNGNYTIGATGDFTTFAGAVNFVATNGVCGPVVFTVESGTYTEQVTLPTILGTSAVNTITFQSATGINTDVVVQYAAVGSTDNWVLAWTGGDYITVQDMTFQSTTTTTYARVVEFRGNSDYNTLSNCNIQSITTTSSNAAGIRSYTDGKDQYNTIIGNTVTGAYYGIYWYGTSTDREDGNQFVDNHISMYYYYGLYLYYNNNVKVNGNTVLQNPTGSVTNYPLTVYYSDGPIEVTKNVIYDNAGSTFYGLRVGYAVATALEPGLIANNMISSEGNTSTQYGLYVYYCNHQKIYYNSVRIANGSTVYAAYLQIPSTAYGPYDFKNNSIVNLGTLGYCLYGTTSAGISMLNSSNNNLYTNSATLCSFTTAYSTLLAWQALYPGDVLNTDGEYISASDLHTFSTYLNGAGTPVPQVTTDIDGQARNSSFPDVGADEFDLLLPANELMVEIVYTLGQLPIGAGDNHVVTAIVRNVGANTQYNVPVTLTISGANSFTNVVTIDSLTFAGVQTVSFSPFTAVTLGVDTVTVSVPPDMDNTNNSATYMQQVTENQIAYADLSPMAVNLGYNTGAGLLLCKYHINGVKVVSAVGAYIVGTSTIGNSLYGVVLDMAGNILSQSAPVVITAIDSIYIFPILNPPATTVINGDIYVGIAQTANAVGYYPLGVQAELPTRSNAFYTAGINGGVVDENSNFGRFTIGAIVIDPAPYDAACVDILSPEGGCGQDMEQVSITIQNFGLNAISGNLTASYQLNNNTVVTETVPTAIPLGGTYDYNFTTLLNLTVPADSTFDLKAWVTLTGDLNHYNDTSATTVQSLYTPAAPVAVDATVLYGSMATLGAISADSIQWFSDTLATIPLGGGSQISIGPLYDTTVLYAQSGTNSLAPGSLLTTMVSGNGQSGVMFDITAYENLTIDSFFVNVDNTGTMEVWYREGSYVGFTGSQTGWTLAGSANVVFAGTNLNSLLPIGGITIPDGETYGIYITFVSGSGINYTNGDGTNEIYQNSDMKIQCGHGGAYFALTFSPRVFNGTVFYSSGISGCPSELVPVTAYVANIPQYDIGVVAENSPSSGVNLGNAEVISVEIQNWGSMPANLFQITYDITGATSSTVSELVINSIASGTTSTFNFATTADLSTYGVYNICVYTQLVGDGYAINDTLCFSVTNSVPSYCVSSATSTAYEEITQVDLSNMSNYSFPQGTMYTNFNLTVAPAILTLGNSHPVSITTSYAPGYTTQYNCWVKVFIDWNNDGTWTEPAETAFSSATTSSNTVTGFISVPGTATLGMHSMRVVFVETTAATSVLPCGTYTWGETEDYQVIIQPPYEVDAGVISILSPSGAMLENSIQPVSVVVYNFGSDTIYSMDVVYTVNGLNPVTTAFTGAIPAFTSATVSLGNLAVPGGNFDLCAYTVLTNDASPGNDGVCVSLFADPQYNLEMTSIDAPVEGCDLGMETVSVTFTNLGDTVIGNIPLSFWTSTMSTPVTETYTGTILPNAVVTYTFTTAINLAVTIQTEFEIFAWLSYLPDPVLTNDTTSIVIISGISPGSPVAYDVTIWGGNIATLNIVNPDSNNVYTWYDAANNQLGTGTTLVTPVLFDTTIYYVNAASGSAGSLALTEFDLGDPDYIEIQNVTNSVIDATGWVVAVSETPYTDINTVNPNYWNLGVIQPGQVLTKSDLASASNYWGSNLFWNPGTPPSFTGWAMIVDNLGNVVDFMSWGWTEAQIYGMNVTINGFPIDMTTAWIGNSMMSYPSNFITRINYDDDVVTDWINATAGSMGLPNPNMVISGGSGVGCAGPLVPVTVFVQYAQYDGAVLTMTSPVSASNLGNVSITVDLYNNGLMPLSNFLVQYTISGYTPVFGTVAGPLAPGQSISYTFPTQFNASTFGTYNICIKTLVTGDGYPANDEFCTSFANWDGNGESCSTSFPYLLINEPPVYQTTIHPYDRQWWRFELPVAATNVDVSLCGSAFDTKLEIHSQCPQTVFGTASYLGYNDNSCSTQSLVHFNSLSAGTYWAKVYGYQAAFGDYVLEITGDLADIAIVNFSVNQIMCNGAANGSIVASVVPIIPGATLPLSYLWSNQSTSLTLTNLAPGTYILTITDATGIPQIESVTITQPPLLDATLTGVDATTIGGNNGSITTTVTGGVSPYFFTWSNGATTQNIASAYAGIYSVTISDTNGCILEKNITINSPLPPGWIVTPTANSHLIIVSQNSNISLDGITAAYGSLIGVFSNQNGTVVCSGWAYWSGMSTSVTAYGATPPLDNGYQPGEVFTWRLYEAALGVQYDGNACYLTGYPNQGNYATGGFSGINCLNAQSIITQAINLPTGWSIWSTYLIPVNPNMMVLFNSIATQVTIVKSGSGAIYWPVYNLNTIGNLIMGQGYQVKMVSAQTLAVQGLLINPSISPITIPGGWSIMGYLRTSPMNAVTVISPIVSNVVIVKSGGGQIYWPLYNLNTIGNMVPGQGYQIKMVTQDVLTFAMNTSAPTKSDVISVLPEKYNKVNNTGHNMSLGILESAWNVAPQEGDEIGVFNAKGDLVGSTVYRNGFNAITIWGDDSQTENVIEGIANGEVFTLKLWDQENNTEQKLIVQSWLQGNNQYGRDAISVIEKLTISGKGYDSFMLFQNRPNPFRDATEISFYLPEASNVILMVYNTLGEKIEELVSSRYEAGKYSVTFETGNLAPGTYFYKIVGDKFTDTKVMNIQ
ncbi:MAG: right-handed parallel beta-helix repeat-containing protein [Bacteroidales bacterium]|nr:right-handed parallel beta-helix repeat-containing protein [Bacteroidales bacterium]MCF8457248.1 right-handed parallel beta-helix repeat-containing protein [Bacteroidales bacterium]